MPTAELEAATSLSTALSWIEALPPRAKRKLWTRDEVDALEKLGAFVGQRLELVDGELIDKMGKNRPHVFVVELIRQWLFAVFGAGFVLQESPIDVAAADNRTSEPEPDVVVLNRPLGAFLSSSPGPADVRLIVEVSDSTLYVDLKTKASLFARAGILDYWVADIEGRRLIVHRNPGAGRYGEVRVYGAQDAVAPLAAPDSWFRLSDCLPPAPTAG
jgi:Uma2 family endonuclease